MGIAHQNALGLLFSPVDTQNLMHNYSLSNQLKIFGLRKLEKGKSEGVVWDYKEGFIKLLKISVPQVLKRTE